MKKLIQLLILENQTSKLVYLTNNNKIIYSSTKKSKHFLKKTIYQNLLKKLSENQKKKFPNHIDKITLLLDDPSFFTIDLSIKKNNDQIQTLNEIQYSAFLDCSQIINKFHKNITNSKFFY